MSPCICVSEPRTLPVKLNTPLAFAPPLALNDIRCVKRSTMNVMSSGLSCEAPPVVTKLLLFPIPNRPSFSSSLPAPNMLLHPAKPYTTTTAPNEIPAPRNIIFPSMSSDLERSNGVPSMEKTIVFLFFLRFLQQKSPCFSHGPFRGGSVRQLPYRHLETGRSG